MQGQCKPVRGEKQGMTGKKGALRGCWEEGVGEAGVQRGMRSDTKRGVGSQATWEGGQPQKGAHPILWKHLQKLTDLSANPGVYQTVPETSVQLCTPGWSRVPGEKMLSGKIPGSVLGKQRQTHNGDHHGGWMQGNPLPPGLCGHTSHQRESSMWPSNSCSHQASL